MAEVSNGRGAGSARPRGGGRALVGLVLRESARSFLRNQHMDTAAMLSYYGFLSIVPLLLLVSVLSSRLVMASEAAREAIRAGADELIAGFGVVALDQLRTLSQQRIWGVLGMLVLFWSVTPIAAGFRASLTRVFQPDRIPGVLHAKLRDVLGALTIVAMFFLLVAGRILYGVLARHLPGQVTFLTDVTQLAFSFTISVAGLAFLFVVFAPTRLRAGELFSGAVVSAVLLLVIRPAFAAFLRYNPDYGFAFGSLKALFLTLTWIYFSFVAILYGAEIMAAARRREIALLTMFLPGGRAGGAASDALVGRFSRALPAGETVFHEGEPGHEMFIVRSGAVEMRRGERVLATMRAGEYFGEMSMLIDSPRTATAVVVEDAKLIAIRRESFDAILRENPAIGRSILRELAARLKAADEKLHRE
ncbi:MAG: cyclic nucleotide-binding domain-containing protein [Lentisphaerae bacterium]|nr:cyclic nucleotide-binding domain-containing protein [Lentisphaerota bacterium]